jgi:allophanate hydrolase subunit 1
MEALKVKTEKRVQAIMDDIQRQMLADIQSMTDAAQQVHTEYVKPPDGSKEDTVRFVVEFQQAFVHHMKRIMDTNNQRVITAIITHLNSPVDAEGT